MQNREVLRWGGTPSTQRVALGYASNRTFATTRVSSVFLGASARLTWLKCGRPAETRPASLFHNSNVRPSSSGTVNCLVVGRRRHRAAPSSEPLCGCHECGKPAVHRAPGACRRVARRVMGSWLRGDGVSRGVGQLPRLTSPQPAARQRAGIRARLANIGQCRWTLQGEPKHPFGGLTIRATPVRIMPGELQHVLAHSRSPRAIAARLLLAKHSGATAARRPRRQALC